MNFSIKLLLVAIQIMAFSFQAYADEAKARNEVQQDLLVPIQMSSDDRICIDGTSPAGKTKIDYWVDFECPYCRVNDIVKFQQENKDTCIVVRHTPSIGKDSMTKALAYEALLQVNASAANTFWSEVYPQQGLSKPFQKPIMNALDSILMSVEEFEPYIDKVATTVDTDNQFSTSILSYTPTFVIEGIRFTACDFNAEQLEKVIPIAKAARNGDYKAKEKVIEIITNGLTNQPLF